MPGTEHTVTDSWIAHKDFLNSVQRFLDEIRIQEGEVWIGEVCFGTSSQPCVRAPLSRDSAAVVGQAVDSAQALAAAVTETLRRALQITHDTVRKLQSKGVVEEADLARVTDRSQELEGLLERLTSAAIGSPLAYHPANLCRWHEILQGSFVPGNPAVEVRVVTTYVL